jgi:hypothetical protein
MNRILIDEIRFVDSEIKELDAKINFLKLYDKGSFKQMISDREFSKSVRLKKRNILVKLVIL